MNLSQPNKFSNKIQELIKDDKNIKPSKKLFKNYKYSIKDNIFVVFNNIDGSMFIQNIENISNERNLSFNVYSALLNKRIFKSIFTGDALTKLNIKSHLKYINKKHLYNLYINNKKKNREYR